jgi:hypothetical protein
MASLLIVRPYPNNIVTPNLGTGGPNLLTPDPKEVWVGSSGGGTYFFDIDLGSPQTADFIFAGFSSFPVFHVTSLWTATGMNTGLSAVNFTASGQLTSPRGPRNHNFASFAPLTSRYWRVGVNCATSFSLGILALGRAVQPTWGREWGSGRQVTDMSAVQPLRGGGYGIERGARKPGFQFTCGDLTDAEVEDLWQMALEIGESAPVIVVEDPDRTAGLNERIHYGLFDRPEEYQRLLPGATRWGFRLKGWV